MSGNQDILEDAETGIQDCYLHTECNSVSGCNLSLSQIPPGADRRGSRNPKVLLVTEAPDEESGEGTAYQGGISSRIQNYFCEEEYGIGLQPDGQLNFSDFLDRFRFYATSAIKCCITSGSGSEVGQRVVHNCTEEYLYEQIRAMPRLEMVIPMGAVATAALLQQSISEIRLTSLLGSEPQGILYNHDRWGADIIVLPHPSGASPLSNPPIVNGQGSRTRWGRVRSFRSALRAVRSKLESMGYDVFDDDPACWNSPDGLSRFNS